MRCDLHVHSKASGMCDTPGLNRICRESYNDPREVYERLRQKGMSLVTVTDHDSIDAAEALCGYAGYFLSEEVLLPTGTAMHLGVYDITERDHLEIQNRRQDFVALLMYLTERKRFFSVNHVFSGLTGRRQSDDFNWFASYIPAFETRNGQMCRAANENSERLASRLGKIALGGSDSHTVAGLGLTYTEVPGAATVEEFFAGLRQGRSRVRGMHGGYAKLTVDVFSIVASLFGERPWTLLISPLALLVPAFTAGHWLGELRFCKKWSAAVDGAERPPRMLWDVDQGLEANWAS
ncbi:MAG: hypothetical protein NVS9B4_03340 [Candidatus Acidiferrum sp.]